MSIIFLVPTLNEELHIGQTLDKILECSFDKQIIVVDGHSSDHTLDIVKNYDVKIIQQKSYGKGGAVNEALEEIDPDSRVIMIDGDNTYDPRDAENFIPYFQPGVLINGSRFKEHNLKGSMKRLHIYGNKLINLCLRIFHHYSMTDLCSGMKGFIASDIKALNLHSMNFEIEAEIVIKYIRHYTIIEVPISYKERVEDSKLHPFRDGFKIVRRIIREKWNT